MNTRSRITLSTIALIFANPLLATDRAKAKIAPTPTPALTTVTKSGSAATRAKLYLPAAKIDAVGIVSGFTPCQGLLGSGYVKTLPGGDLMRTDSNTVGYCAVGWVRVKKTGSAAPGTLTLTVAADHLNVTPWTVMTTVYQLPFPASGDTLTFSKVALGSYPGDNLQPDAWRTNEQRLKDANYAFRAGRKVVLELKSGDTSLDSRNCTFTSPATFACAP